MSALCGLQDVNIINGQTVGLVGCEYDFRSEERGFEPGRAPINFYIFITAVGSSQYI